MKVKISYLRKRDRWRVDYRLNGVRNRPSFETKAQAETEMARIKGDVTKAKAELLTMAREEQAELVEIIQEARKEGVELRDVWKVFKQHRHMPAKASTVKQCFEDFMTEKRAMRLSPDTIAALDCNVSRFVDLNPAKLITHVTRQDVLGYLSNKDWGPRTFNSYLTSLNTFFLWCVRTDRLAKSPAATIRKIPRRQMPDIDKPPVIVSVDGLQRFLLAAWYNDPDLLRAIVVGAFGGARPEKESRDLHKKDFTKGQILIRGSNAKDRARRYITINPTLAAWLELCPEIKPITNFRRRWELLRAQAGLIRRTKKPKVERKEVVWTGWGHDCLRHTFASNYLPVYGAEAAIEQLGHGDYDMLFGHYRALRSKGQAEKFWKHFESLAIQLAKGCELLLTLRPAANGHPSTTGAKHGIVITAKGGSRPAKPIARLPQKRLKWE
jgi:integrase